MFKFLFDDNDTGYDPASDGCEIHGSDNKAGSEADNDDHMINEAAIEGDGSGTHSPEDIGLAGEDLTEASSSNDLPSSGGSSRPSPMLSFFDIFETVALSMAVVFVCFTFLFRICIVDGQSMENTLYNGEKLIVTELLGDAKAGDIIVFHETGYFKEPLVKRVIATEGQWIDIKPLTDGTLQVTIYDENMENPVVLDEPYAAYKTGGGYPASTYNEFPKQVPEGCLFVMGDNRNNSSDSRSKLVGFVDSRRVLGKLVLRILPVSRFGTVD